MAEETGRPVLILPPGTQIVTRIEVKAAGDERPRPPGAVGVVVHAPADQQHSYRVRFPDGREAALRRSEFAIRKHFQRDGVAATDDPVVRAELHRHIIFRCIVGSRTYGLDADESDTDRRGIYLPPAELHWSLAGAPEQLENEATQECYWELQKFLLLALKANPNVLECLYTPLVELAAPPADELLANRAAFLSRLVYQTYNGYVMSQFKKLEQDLRSRGEIKWKHAMHLIRLLLSGVTVLREGEVRVHVGNERERLLAIRRGALSWHEMNAWRLRLHRDFDAAYAGRTLLERLSMTIDPRLTAAAASQPYPLLFVTISGAHLYGFPSPDSDYDLRGVHLLPAREVVGLQPGRETIESSSERDGLELDLVTHDARKFFLLLLKKTGYVLEQLYSPLIVHTTPEHEELKTIASGCITRHHSHHYFGFAQTQWKLFDKERPRRVKPLLYVYRVLLTGIHLMRTGEVEANLISLNAEHRLPYLDELIARKLSGPEQSALADADVAFHQGEYERLRSVLEEAHQQSRLPERPTSRTALNDLLVRLRLRYGTSMHNARPSHGGSPGCEDAAGA